MELLSTSGDGASSDNYGGGGGGGAGSVGGWHNILEQAEVDGGAGLQIPTTFRGHGGQGTQLPSSPPGSGWFAGGGGGLSYYKYRWWCWWTLCWRWKGGSGDQVLLVKVLVLLLILVVEVLHIQLKWWRRFWYRSHRVSLPNKYLKRSKMSQLFVDNIKGRTGGAIGAPSGVNATGVVTATTFSGNVTGVAATFSGNVVVGGTLNYEDVTNIDSLGIVTARSGIRVGAGESIGSNSGTGIIRYGSNLSGVISGIELESEGNSVGAAITNVNFVDLPQ